MENSIIKCPCCGEVSSKNKINKHLKFHHGFKVTYQNILQGKAEEKIYLQEDTLIPSAVKRSNSSYVNCPICQDLLKPEVYKYHYKTKHKEKLDRDIHELNGHTSNENAFWCPYEDSIIKKHRDLFVQGTYRTKDNEVVPKFHCYTCDRTFIAVSSLPEGERTSKQGTIIYNVPELLSDKVQQKTMKQNQQIKNMEKERKKIEEKQVYYQEEKDFSDVVLVVYDRFPSTACVSGAHDKESVVIQTKYFSGLNTGIEAFYCKKCNKFFTNYEAIKPYFKDLKPLISIHCEYIEEGRRDFSELSLFGYNVDARDLGNDEYERRKLLRMILDNRLIKKDTIISLLHSFIYINGNKKNMQHARDCWKKDIEFVSTYPVPKERKLEIERIKIIYKNRS